MSQPNRKYKRLEALLSESKPVDPDPTHRTENGEVEALKAKVASLEAERERIRTKAQSKAIWSETIPTTFGMKPVMPETANEKQVEELNARNAYRVLLAFIAVQFFVIGFLLFLTTQTPSWQLWTMDGLGVGLMTFEIVGMVYVRRGRHELGIWLSFIPFLTVLFVIPLLYSGLGLLFLVSSMTITTLVGSQTLLPRQSTLFIRIGMMVGAADLLMDLYLPFQRTTLPGFQNIIYFSLAFLLLVLSYAIIRQFRDYSLRTKLLLGFLGVLVMAGLVGAFAVRQQFNGAEQAAVTEARHVAETLGVVVARNQVELQELIQQLHDTQQRELEVIGPDLRVLADVFPDDIGTIFAYDQNGEVAATLKDGQPRTFVEISDDYPQGNRLIVVPFRDKSGKIIGAVILGYQSLYEEAQQSANTATRSLIVLGLAGLLLAFVISQFISASIASPISHLSSAALKIGNGQLDTPIPVRPANDEVGILASTFKNMTAQLRGLIGSLEQRVAERTRDLEIAAEVGRAVSEKSVDVYGLLKDAVNLICERFHLYYAQIYLADPAGLTLTLRAGSGEVGAELLRRGHSLPLNTTSINGRAAAERVPVIVSDTGQSAYFLPNPQLPNTSSEMAIPLIAGGKIVGVLDMQSTFVGALNETNLPAFEALAGQIAIAIQNAGLFAQSEEARRQVEAIVRQTKETGWQDFLNAIERGEKIGYTFKRNDLIPTENVDAMKSTNALSVPIMVTGANVGAIHLVEEERKWTAQETEIVKAAAGQLAQHIDNLRLLAQAESYRSEAEQAVRRLTREGWETFVQTRSDLTSGFTYDLNNVHALESGKNNGGFESTITKQFVVRNETVGELAVNIGDKSPQDMNDLITAVAEQLGDHIENLRLSEQNEKRAFELATVATVSTTASTVLDPDKLLQSVVDLTKERFNLYHTHIYLTDESWKTLLLAAGAGDVGRQMVAAGHAIQIDAEKSLVARASRERNPIIVNDVQSEADFLPNLMLPKTRAEMAVPMIAGDKVIGVFDVQSDTAGHFTEEDAHIYTTLASQVAVALQNARLYVEQSATVTQLRELDRLKSSFLANMSHELRTPLNSILGFADVMLEELDGPLTDNMNNDLGLIQKNGQHLLHLINDVLDMAKIESGKMNLNPETFKVHEILEDVTSIASTLASEKNLSLFIDKESDKNLEIFADRTRLRQVMINIVNNAIKFTEQGKISIHAKQKDEHVLIYIKDTGIGISPDKLEAVFQEFTQVNVSSTRQSGGTGLGLPISRRLIELHGGRIWGESTGVSGEGCTFYIELPIKAKIAEPIEKQEK